MEGDRADHQLLDPCRDGASARGSARVLDGIIIRLRSGCQWRRSARALRRDIDRSRLVSALLSRRPAGGTLGVSRQGVRGARWCALGVAGRRRGDGQEPLLRRRERPKPTDRAKMGTKKSVLVEQDGGPLSTVIDGANVHDTKLLERTIDAIVVPRPDPKDLPQNLCSRQGVRQPDRRGRLRRRRLRPAHPPHRRGEARHLGSEDPPGPQMGRRAHHRLATRSAAHSWSATTRSPPTTSGSSNSPARSSGTGAATAYFTPDEFSDSS